MGRKLKTAHSLGTKNLRTAQISLKAASPPLVWWDHGIQKLEGTSGDKIANHPDLGQPGSGKNTTLAFKRWLWQRSQDVDLRRLSEARLAISQAGTVPSWWHFYTLSFSSSCLTRETCLLFTCYIPNYASQWPKSPPCWNALSSSMSHNYPKLKPQWKPIPKKILWEQLPKAHLMNSDNLNKWDFQTSGKTMQRNTENISSN